MFNFPIFEKILKLNIGVAQADNKKMFSLLGKIHPLRIHQFASGSEHNGWVIPGDWHVKRATISYKGKVVFDGTIHPLAVVGHSCSFKGKLTKKQLDEHIYYRKDLPEAYVYNFMLSYKPWLKKWGFSVPFKIYKSWPDGEYQIDLQTVSTKGKMLVGEIHHRGKSKDTIVFNAHTCHPCQFNDDLSGVAVILELFKWLKGKKTKYSYKAILGPEHFATVFYLSRLSLKDRANLKGCAFVEMVGIKSDFALQQSFTGESTIDSVAEYALRKHAKKLRVGRFRTIVGNDETVWEAPGIEIPCVSISRCYHSPHYYPQYHTQLDDLSITSKKYLAQTLSVLKEMITVFEKDSRIMRTFDGLVALSNPKYNLYIQRAAPGVRKTFTQQEIQLGSLQDVLPRYFDGKHTIAQLAQKFSVDFDVMRDYVERFAQKGLVKLK